MLDLKLVQSVMIESLNKEEKKRKRETKTDATCSLSFDKEIDLNEILQKDPADTDKELLEKLERNKKMANEKREKVMKI